MPLHDHFHLPLKSRVPWTSIGTLWVAWLVRALSKKLPRDRYQTLANIHLGQAVEADIAEFELPGRWPSDSGDDAGGVATFPAPPPALLTVTANCADVFEVQVKDHRDGMSLVGVIEFVSPPNKDREGERAKFVAKCLAYLDQGVGVVVVDVVTDRTANLHNELVVALRAPLRAQLADANTYVAGYRPNRVADVQTIDLWPYAAPVGAPLPSVPLALRGGPLVLIDLESPYAEAAADHGLITLEPDP